MKLMLFSETPPSGSCVTVAKAISKATGLGVSESMYRAKELFSSHYGADNPLELTIVSDGSPAELKEVCEQNGILIREQEA